MIFRHCGAEFDLSVRTLIVGILNVTPDSFSDGGRFFDPESAIAHGLQLVEDGADILDIGGESTRPNSEPVSAAEEIRRILPVIEGIRRRSATPVSVDTYKARVAAAAIESGASIVNDVSSLGLDTEMAAVVRDTGAGVILMHMQGTPRTMQVRPCYGDVVKEVCGFLNERVRYAAANGIEAERITVDPGIGFGKTYEHNLQLLQGLSALNQLGRPILVGTSRKSFLTQIVGRDIDARDWGTAATVAFCIAQGAHAVRVHNVHLCRQVARMTEAVMHGA